MSSKAPFARFPLRLCSQNFSASSFLKIFYQNIEGLSSSYLIKTKNIARFLEFGVGIDREMALKDDSVNEPRKAGERRPRRTRKPTGKRLGLTRRDLEIFHVLSRYRFLRSTYLYALVGGKSRKRF
ncbi:MAG: hypothetical protein R3229_18700, partial [Alphaproteobacteria bacterium]|nr:hypothetical protein [Alphaproteobacteria bacterium]